MEQKRMFYLFLCLGVYCCFCTMYIAVRKIPTFALLNSNKLSEADRGSHQNNTYTDQGTWCNKSGKSSKMASERKVTKPVYITLAYPRGRIGNQMFQLASLLGLAAKNNFIPYLSTQNTFYLHLYFKIPSSFYRSDIVENQTIYESNLLEKMPRSRNWTINNFLQNLKLFENVEALLHKYFTFHDSILFTAKGFVKRYLPVGHIKVAIHVRRGDTRNDAEVFKGRQVPGPEYFRRAMDHFMRQNASTTFLVVSDEMHWCLSNIRGPNIKYSPYKSPDIDLALVTLCDHVIISVGTFGWWGGWLAGGSVVYYRDHFVPGSELDRYIKQENYFPSHWIPMV